MGYEIRDVPVRGKAQQPVLSFGRMTKAEFPFDPEWRNLNHGTDLC
jgi:hypothetical protein